MINPMSLRVRKRKKLSITDMVPQVWKAEGAMPAHEFCRRINITPSTLCDYLSGANRIYGRMRYEQVIGYLRDRVEGAAKLLSEMEARGYAAQAKPGINKLHRERAEKHEDEL